MDFISVFIIAIALAMDAFSVAITSGIIFKKIHPWGMVKTGLFFGVFQFLMPCLGFLLGSAFANFISSCDHWIAFALLGFIGGKMLYEAIKGDEDEGEEIKNPLDNKLLTMLAIATSIDALAVGVTFATMGMSIVGAVTFGQLNLLISSAIIGIVAFVLSAIGVFIGGKCGNLFGNKAEILGGIVDSEFTNKDAVTIIYNALNANTFNYSGTDGYKQGDKTLMEVLYDLYYVEFLSMPTF